jgi:hypothetical protein
MRSPESQLALARAMLEELESYLLSKELLWPLSRHAPPGEPPYPRLTLGNLLLTLDALGAMEDALPPTQAARVQELKTRLQALKGKHAAAMQAKAVQEARMRANLWKAFLQDLDERRDEPQRIGQEVHHRLMAARLREFIFDDRQWEALEGRLRAADRRLDAHFAPGPFLLEPALRKIYPRQDFPFLYLKPKAAGPA